MSVPAAVLDPARAAAVPRLAPRPAVGAGRGWTLYLILTVLLIPLVRPIGPGQIAIGDLFNVIALAVFAVLTLAKRPRLRLPLIIPVTVIAAASLIATTNATSPVQSFITMAQDAYLYLWFVMLVNVCEAQEDLRPVRIAWLVASAGIALYGAYSLAHSHGYGLRQLLSPKGDRAVATFGNPNFFADYIVLSLFVIMSLGRELSWRIRLPALGAIMLGLVASKSLGGLLALVAGLGTWFVVRAVTRRASKLSLVAAILVVLGVGVLGGFVVQEWGIGRQGLQAVASGSMVGRLGKSSGSRLQIWGELRHRFERSPLGIGPGNSSLILLPVENRERRGGSVQGKEAHNDYVGYVVERGPFALLAMVAMIFIALRLIWTSWSSVSSTRLREGIAGAWAAAFAAGLVASAVHSFTIEKLHFRHYWFFLAMLFALCTRMTNEPRRELDPAPR